MEKNDVILEWVVKGKRKWLKFIFINHLDETQARTAIEKWENYFTELPLGSKTDLIFQCKQMKGYDTSARIIWQRMMMDSRSQIGEVWIISDSRLILTAAKTMSLLTKFNIKAAKDEELIYENRSQETGVRNK